MNAPPVGVSSHSDHVSEQPSPAAAGDPAPAAVAPASRSGASALFASQTRTFGVASGAIVFLAIGVLGTWVKALGGLLSVSGIDTADGKLALVIAFAAGLCLWRFAKSARKSALGIAGVLGIVDAAIAVAYISDFSSRGEFVAPGWGLYILMIAAVVLPAACIKLWRDA
jgi:hypothetical protein